MPIIAFGINHKTAPIAVREQLAFDAAHIQTTLTALNRAKVVNEAVILSTCNRTELYAQTDRARDLIQWLVHQILLPMDSQGSDGPHSIRSYFYTYYGESAIRHMIRVASGLDSLIVGEPEIFGQMKQAYALAQKTQTTGWYFDQLFPMIFCTTKHIRNHASVGNTMSMPYVMLQLAKQHFSDLNACRVLLIGAGKVIGQVVTYLSLQGLTEITVANRSIHRASQLAQHFHLKTIRMDEVTGHLPYVDFVISATGSQQPILDEASVSSALKHQESSKILMMDLGVPRDIAPAVKNVPGVALYHLDDLHTLLKEQDKTHAYALGRVEAVIQLQAAYFMQKIQALGILNTIESYRKSVEKISTAVADEAFNAIKNGQQPEWVIKKTIDQLTKKMMHLPTLQMRKAAYAGTVDYLTLLTDLFSPVEDDNP